MTLALEVLYHIAPTSIAKIAVRMAKAAVSVVIPDAGWGPNTSSMNVT